ncbi:hypothetical protein CBR_g12979 [Chara braunii]|uniref:Integrase zinc-binding domain-containing protein n=1 Tax=Chara braunii TaxID=69332 RepID=A0A388KT70_CHABU|nr:hypothetical protein CBR_g12979 [Chara braunii]|eukprot:GBG73261.1 hypothetical protein CBR_g12979 [Chara braunii]
MVKTIDSLVTPQTHPDPTILYTLDVSEASEDLQGEWSARDPPESWVALSRGPRGEHFVVEVDVGGRKCGAFVDIGSTRNFISRDCVDKLCLKDRVQHLSRPVAFTLANKECMMVEDYVKDVVCTFSYPGGEINHKISFLVSDELPFDMLLGMYYLEVAKPQFDWDKKVLKHELPHGRTVKLAKYKANYLGALISDFDLSEDVTRSLDEAYKEDPITMDIINKLQAKHNATTDEFVMVDGLLFLEKAGFKRLVVPSRETLRSLFLGECHDATRHFDYKKTSANLVQRFWWPNMLDDVKKYVETYQVCQRDKPRTQAPLGLLKPLPIPVGPGQSISMDFMDTLVTSKDGKRHIFVIVDRFTKYARLIAMLETARTKHVIKLFMDNWCMTLDFQRQSLVPEM